MMPRGPGKFEGVPEEIPVEELYDLTLGGGAREEIGSVDELGYYALVEHGGRWYILSEDAQGFVDAEGFRSEREARSRWAEIEDAYDRWDRGEEVLAHGGIVRHAARAYRTRFRRGGLAVRKAEGGIVEGPTKAVVGEMGPEAVTPIEPEKAEAMAERMAGAAEEAAEEVEAAVEDTEDERIRRVLLTLADFAEEASGEAEEAAEAAEEAAEEGKTAEAAAAATEAAAHAEAAISAEHAAEEIAPRRRGFSRVWWGA